MGTLYSGLDANSFISKAVVGDPRKQILTDGVTRPAWWNGLIARELGIDVPLVAPSDEGTRPAGSLTALGVYKIVVIYKRSLDGAIGNQSPTLTITLLAGETGARINIPADANLQAGIDTAVVYRTWAGKDAFFKDGEKAYSGSLITYDLTEADSALGLAIETDNNIPPSRPYIAAI